VRHARYPLAALGAVAFGTATNEPGPAGAQAGTAPEATSGAVPGAGGSRGRPS
jgi:hypothetical protein